ncbi:hypothetical protein TL16_g12536 [Triparma laevis f. inornata]|uniref:Uncharacterized protein n=2 Tax=Triparma laevis TaxID=1534972 RepID=A0A9W7FT14_9STRA|nr:hypothetical protein TL16_g12536 [Triparma laevis f. inornata]GMI17802.1 hypothetical protein TrLO_g6320 [Triparma laevis f. longispina]
MAPAAAKVADEQITTDNAIQKFRKQSVDMGGTVNVEDLKVLAVNLQGGERSAGAWNEKRLFEDNFSETRHNQQPCSLRRHFAHLSRVRSPFSVSDFESFVDAFIDVVKGCKGNLDNAVKEFCDGALGEEDKVAREILTAMAPKINQR